MSHPPGWQPDPGGSPLLRWWDGSQWTESVMDPRTTPQSHAAGPSPQPGQAPPASPAPLAPTVQSHAAGPSPQPGQTSPIPPAPLAPTAQIPATAEPSKKNGQAAALSWVGAAVISLAAAAALIVCFVVIPPQVEEAKNAIAQEEKKEQEAKADKEAAEKKLAELKDSLKEIE